MHCQSCGTLTDSGRCDCTKMETGTQNLIPFTLKDLRKLDAATIERCAQKMDNFFENGHLNRAAAAAIREMKDE